MERKCWLTILFFTCISASCAAQSFEEKTSVGLSTNRFVLSDEFPPTRLIFSGEVPVRVLKVIPTTGEQAFQAYGKACPIEKSLNCESVPVWVIER
jgi:hypothetical protein